MLLVLIDGIFLFLLVLSAYLPVSMAATDILSHFVLQYAIAAAVVAVIAVFLKVDAYALVPLAAALVLCAIQLFPLLPVQSGAPSIAGKPFKVLQANIYKRNHDTARLEQLIRRENPDIITLAEVTSAHKPLFAAIGEAYPHQEVIYDDEGSFGIALLSKTPLNHLHVHHFARSSVPAIEAEITIGDETVVFLGIHPYNPLSDFAARDLELAEIAATFSTRNKKLIIAGDFNATPYCPAFKKLRRDLDMRDARRDNGVMGTYPVYFPFSFMRLPIDHLLAGDAYTVINHRLGDDIGSDHFPLVTTLGWKK